MRFANGAMRPTRSASTKLKSLFKNAVTYEDFEKFKSEIIDTFASTLDTPRSEEEIIAAMDRCWDQVWYNRHLNLKARIAGGITQIDPDVWKAALAAAQRVTEKMAAEDLPPYDDFDWVMINGKLSALRWVLGDDWDFLDTVCDFAQAAVNIRHRQRAERPEPARIIGLEGPA